MAVKGGLLIAEVVTEADPKKLKQLVEQCKSFREASGFELVSDALGDPDFLLVYAGGSLGPDGKFVEGQPMPKIPPISGKVILVFQRK